MSAESPSARVETLSVTLKFPDINTFAERFANFLERRRILLPGVAARPPGAALRFHLKLKDGTSLIGGHGHVEAMVAAGAIPGCPPGMVVQFQPDEDCQWLCDRILRARGDAPSPMLPPAVELPSSESAAGSPSLAMPAASSGSVAVAAPAASPVAVLPIADPSAAPSLPSTPDLASRPPSLGRPLPSLGARPLTPLSRPGDAGAAPTLARPSLPPRPALGGLGALGGASGRVGGGAAGPLGGGAALKPRLGGLPALGARIGAPPPRATPSPEEASPSIESTASIEPSPEPTSEPTRSIEAAAAAPAVEAPADAPSAVEPELIGLEGGPLQQPAPALGQSLAEPAPGADDAAAARMADVAPVADEAAAAPAAGDGAEAPVVEPAEEGAAAMAADGEGSSGAGEAAVTPEMPEVELSTVDLASVDLPVEPTLSAPPTDAAPSEVPTPTLEVTSADALPVDSSAGEDAPPGPPVVESPPVTGRPGSDRPALPRPSLGRLGGLPPLGKPLGSRSPTPLFGGRPLAKTPDDKPAATDAAGLRAGADSAAGSTPRGPGLPSLRPLPGGRPALGGLGALGPIGPSGQLGKKPEGLLGRPPLSPLGGALGTRLPPLARLPSPARGVPTFAEPAVEPAPTEDSTIEVGSLSELAAEASSAAPALSELSSPALELPDSELHTFDDDDASLSSAPPTSVAPMFAHSGVAPPSPSLDEPSLFAAALLANSKAETEPSSAGGLWQESEPETVKRPSVWPADLPTSPDRSPFTAATLPSLDDDAPSRAASVHGSDASAALPELTEVPTQVRATMPSFDDHPPMPLPPPVREPPVVDAGLPSVIVPPHGETPTQVRPQLSLPTVPMQVTGGREAAVALATTHHDDVQGPSLGYKVVVSLVLFAIAAAGGVILGQIVPLVALRSLSGRPW